MKLARDTWLIYQRHFLLLFRSPIFILFGLSQPVTYILLFAPLLKVALRAHTYTEAYRIYVPGLLTVMAVLGGSYAGFGLLREVRVGIIERAQVTPCSRLALMLGRAMREVTWLIWQAVIITLLALPSVMAIAISYGLSLKIRNEAALAPMINTVSQPIMLLAGVLLPLTLAPLWLVNIAKWNPFYWATNGMRALFNGHIGNSSVWISLVIVLGLAVLAITWSVRQFDRIAAT